jgi:hypothetical protein
MNLKKLVVVFLIVIINIICLDAAFASMKDVEIVNSQTKVIKDNNGTVKVRLDWLTRPGELALTVDYNGYLTQEGMVNFYLSVNGENRNFVTMKKETRNRSQKTRFISFHPTKLIDGVNKLAPIPEDTTVDYFLFRNAPYYAELGEVKVEVKFFINGRWDGDGNKEEGNYVFSFKNQLKAEMQDHF